MDLGPPELIIILVIVLVLFGGRKLPGLARSLGQAKREFENPPADAAPPVVPVVAPPAALPAAPEPVMVAEPVVVAEPVAVPELHHQD